MLIIMVRVCLHFFSTTFAQAGPELQTLLEYGRFSFVSAALNALHSSLLHDVYLSNSQPILQARRTNCNSVVYPRVLAGPFLRREDFALFWLADMVVQVRGGGVLKGPRNRSQGSFGKPRVNQATTSS